VFVLKVIGEVIAAIHVLEESFPHVIIMVCVALFLELAYATQIGKVIPNVVHAPLAGPVKIVLSLLPDCQMYSYPFGLYLEKGISRPYLVVILTSMVLECSIYPFRLTRPLKFPLAKSHANIPRCRVLKQFPST